MFGSFGTQEILIVAVIALLLFGSAQLPKLMRDMGRSINEFKAGMRDKPRDASQDAINEKEVNEEAKV